MSADCHENHQIQKKSEQCAPLMWNLTPNLTSSSKKQFFEALHCPCCIFFVQLYSDSIEVDFQKGGFPSESNRLRLSRSIEKTTDQF